MFDVIVIGGSYAGLAASLQLARARRRVLILDSGERRNRFASHAHGFLAHDGEPPGAIAAKARADVLAYPTVVWRDAEASEARAVPEGFEVRAGDESFRGKRLILAVGVSDELPAIDGLAQRWGKSVFHCPYCHGYELGLGRVGVLALHEPSMHMAVLAAEWAGPGQAMVFLHDGFEPSADQLQALRERDIRLERSPILRLEGEAPSIQVCLPERSVQLDGLFVPTRMQPRGPFAAQLGLALETSPVGTFIKTDMAKETSVPGVFACGDAGLAMGTVSFAVADGAMAGIGTHRSLVFPR